MGEMILYSDYKYRGQTRKLQRNQGLSCRGFKSGIKIRRILTIKMDMYRNSLDCHFHLGNTLFVNDSVHNRPTMFYNIIHKLYYIVVYSSLVLFYSVCVEPQPSDVCHSIGPKPSKAS